MENESLRTEQSAVVQQEVKSAAEVATTKAPAQKKIRVGYIFLAIIPVAVLIFIQTLSQTPFLIVAAKDLVDSGFNSPDVEAVASELMRIFNDKYAFYSYLIYAVVGLIVFGIWYYKGFVKKSPKVKLSQVFGVKSIVAAVGFAVGMQFAINAAFTLIINLFPHALDAYMELMETAGIVDNVLITVVYAIFLGPILEELCLRGVTFGLLEKSGIKPFFIILITGVLFGAMHMNLVQGIYASFLGFAIGYLRYKYRSVKLTIFMHIFFNLLGSYGMSLLEKIGLSDGMSLILGGIALFVIVFTIVLVNGDKKAYKAPKEE